MAQTYRVIYIHLHVDAWSVKLPLVPQPASGYHHTGAVSKQKSHTKFVSCWSTISMILTSKQMCLFQLSVNELVFFFFSLTLGIYKISKFYTNFSLQTDARNYAYFRFLIKVYRGEQITVIMLHKIHTHNYSGV